MRDMQPQREIVVSGDTRLRARGAASAQRRAGPQRTASPVSRIRTGLGSGAGWLLDRCLTRPAESASTVAVLGAAGYIVVNALGFQHGRHPAPILPQPKPISAREARPAPPAAKPDAAERQKSEPAGAPQKLAAAGDSREALTQLVEETTASVTPKADKSVLQAQQALTKLGYGPLKDDGMIGPGTRAAIERFEREHKLPVTGEAAGRTLKELATRASRKR